MIELPFKLLVDYILKDGQTFNKSVFCKVLSEIKAISPTPELKIYISNVDSYETIQNIIKDYQVKADYYIYYDENLEFLPDFSNINLVFKMNTPDLYSKIKKQCNFKYKILVEPSFNMCEKAGAEFKKIKQDESLCNIFLTPYLTDNELKNLGTKNNRSFLTCASAWLNPIIDNNGDIYCCFNNKIGNIKDDLLINIWNNLDANNFREELIKQKTLSSCSKCLKKYFLTFLIVDNQQLEYKNNIYNFNSTLNFIPSCPKVLICGEKIKENLYTATPVPIFFDEELNKYIDYNLLLLE